MFTLKVREVERHSKSLATIYFSKKLKAYPGQFVMVNVFGFEEIPLSLSSPNSVTVKAVGKTTEKLVNIQEGESLGIRGPFGNPFSPTSDSALIIAGGIGIAPLIFLHDFLVKCGADVRMIYGVRSRSDFIFPQRFLNCVFLTEDGSFGIKGKVTDAVKKENLNEFEKIYVCGPKAMMEWLIDYFERRGVIEKSEFSVERYMRCGIGVCGSCVTEKGLRACVEGPVFSGKELR